MAPLATRIEKPRKSVSDFITWFLNEHLPSRRTKAGTAFSKSTLDNYRIAFMARGSAVDRGVDLYAINATYKDPGTRRTRYGTRRPPVRNGMIANLALDLLDLPAVEGSEFDVELDLRLTAP